VKTIDSWTYLDAPAASAASTRLAEPSVRMRLFSAHALPSAAFEIGGMLVARLTTAS
jgi:hypothetical protein